MIGTLGISDGRMAPLIIVDTQNRPDIDALVEAHKHFRSGDSKSMIGFPSRWRHKTLCLAIDFIGPQGCGIYLEFDIVSQGVIVDQIVHTEMLYIQPGKPGDRLADHFDAPRILIELPFRDFLGIWSVGWRDALVRNFRKSGMSRREALGAAMNIISEWHEMGSQRVGGP